MKTRTSAGESSAGGIYLTVEDIYRWDQALYTEKLLSKKYQDIMFKPYGDAFDSLRHPASTIMILESLGTGFGLADEMKAFGHSKIETTLRCVHPDFERMKIALDTVARKGYNPALKKARKE